MGSPFSLCSSGRGRVDSNGDCRRLGDGLPVGSSFSLSSSGRGRVNSTGDGVGVLPVGSSFSLSSSSMEWPPLGLEGYQWGPHSSCPLQAGVELTPPELEKVEWELTRGVIILAVLLRQG